MHRHGFVKIAFFQPTAEQRIGGLDAAIQGINHALISSGHEVAEGTVDDPFDIAHFHGLWQPAHARIARELFRRRVPYVVSPHGMLEPWAWRHKWWKKWPYFQLRERRHLAQASALLATAPAEARRLAHFAPRQRIEALPLGFTGKAQPDYAAARRGLGWMPEEIVLLYLSRLHVKKGADLLLRALASMRWPVQTRLVFVGDGDRPFVDSLHTFASCESACLPRINWVGAIWGDARWKYFQGADLFCLPTHSENFGLAVLESLQVGTPVLTTTNTPWVDEVADEHGKIVSPDVNSLRGGLAAFFKQPRTTPTTRLAIAQWTAARYDWSQLAPRYSTFFQTTASIGSLVAGHAA